MIIIDLSELKPTEIETLLRMFYANHDAMSRQTYIKLQDTYAAICGDDELNELMTEIEAIADDQR